MVELLAVQMLHLLSQLARCATQFWVPPSGPNSPNWWSVHRIINEGPVSLSPHPRWRITMAWWTRWIIQSYPHKTLVARRPWWQPPQNLLKNPQALSKLRKAIIVASIIENKHRLPRLPLPSSQVWSGRCPTPTVNRSLSNKCESCRPSLRPQMRKRVRPVAMKRLQMSSNTNFSQTHRCLTWLGPIWMKTS